MSTGNPYKKTDVLALLRRVGCSPVTLRSGQFQIVHSGGARFGACRRVVLGTIGTQVFDRPMCEDTIVNSRRESVLYRSKYARYKPKAARYESSQQKKVYSCNDENLTAYPVLQAKTAQSCKWTI